MVIFALAIMGVLMVTMLSTGGDDKQGSLSLQEGTRSFYAAEAGLNNVFANWTAQQYDTLVPTPGNSADLGWQTLPENGSRYRAVIQRVAAGAIYPITLTVDGRSAAPRSGLRTISVLLMTHPRFSDAIFGKGSVGMGGGSTTDSYDSDSAAYNAGTANHNGDVGSNGDLVELSGGERRQGEPSLELARAGRGRHGALPRGRRAHNGGLRQP